MVPSEHSGRFIHGKTFFLMVSQVDSICPAAKIREIICTISCLAACSHPVFAAADDDGDDDLDVKKQKKEKKVWTDKREKEKN